jgi:hypothetical protein
LFDDLRDDGISEGFKSVHPSGNPISHSTHVGFREPPTRLDIVGSFRVASLGAFVSFARCAVGVGHRRCSTNCVCSGRFVGPPIRRTAPIADSGDADPFPSLARGVCHNPDAISSVRGVDGASWNNKWGDFIPDAFQVRKAALEAQRFVNKASHILPNDPSRP